MLQFIVIGRLVNMTKMQWSFSFCFESGGEPAQGWYGWYAVKPMPYQKKDL